jgi:Abnormal spindle-like microcephaly-assoc'd, ASPM-SPD-2-Hydin
LTNSGGSSVTISTANVSGTGFSISGLNLPMILTPNQSVTFTTTFAPTTSGAGSGTLTIASNASNPSLSIGLSGTGTATAQLSLSQPSLSFGTIADGSNSSLSANLTAAGSSVTVSSATSNNSAFVLSGISLPVTIPAGQSVSFTVTFTPGGPGSASGSLTFTSNASGSPTVQSLTGTGQPWVGLAWQPTSGAASYNVYRKLTTDQNYTQIDNGDSATSYTDNNVTAGTTYDYVVTAVNSENQESSYSNMAQAAVPNN